MRPFPRSVTSLTIFKFRGLAGIVLYFYSSVEGEVDKRTFHFGFSIDCITPVHFYGGGGGYPLVDSIKGYPKEFHWRVTRSWWLEEWFWKLSRPIPLLHFFLQSRAHSYGKHAPEMESVALHYIHLRVRAAISGRKSAGRGGTLPLNRFKNSLWDSCHLGTTCTTNLDVWLAAQCFWNTFLIFHFLSYVDCSIRNFIVM
jgi:hypothetical protein